MIFYVFVTMWIEKFVLTYGILLLLLQYISELNVIVETVKEKFNTFDNI